MATRSLRRRGRTGGKIESLHPLRRHRPVLERLEDRLQPGDTIMGGMVAGLWLAQSSLAGEEELLPAPVVTSELHSELDDGSELVETAVPRIPRHSETSAPTTQMHRPSPDGSAEAGFAEVADARLIQPRAAARLSVAAPTAALSGAESVAAAPAAGLIRPSPAVAGVAAIQPQLINALPGNRPDGSAGDTRGGDSIRVLHNFDEHDGSYPYTDLVRDKAGNFYGMSVTGGESAAGTVFQLSPTSAGWVYKVLHNFTGGLDGGQPYGGVTFNAEGKLYGTAVIGGTGQACEEGCGVVWELTPSNGEWSHKTIHNFQGGDDGAGPGGPVSFDNLGNLYGMTPIGGTFGIGTVFELAPQSNGQWTKSTVHNFTGGDDGGGGSAGRLLIEEDRGIFGVATVGGANGVGTVFKIEPASPGSWTYTTLYAFKGKPNDGVFPYGGLVKDVSGNLYGTTYYGGTQDVGVVYMLKPVGDTWKERVLYHFQGGDDGGGSISKLIFGRDGSLYGTTAEGGGSCNCGTIFKLSPTANRTWEETVLYRFKGAPDGAYPYAGLVADETGKMYGVTSRGGEDDDGAAYVFKP